MMLHGKLSQNKGNLYGTLAAQLLCTASFANKADFPVVGNENTVYIAQDENAMYRYNADDMYYYCIGRDYTEIEFINGGIQNG